MSVADDIAKIAEQEKRLAFSAFDEATAFTIGSALRERALAENLPVVIQVSVWGLGCCSTPRCRAHRVPI